MQDLAFAITVKVRKRSEGYRLPRIRKGPRALAELGADHATFVATFCVRGA